MPTPLLRQLSWVAGDQQPASRRDFLQAAAAAVGGLAVNGALAIGAPKEPDREIVIIGAGLCGLMAAYELKKAGFKKLTVLEARDRVGGRALTVPGLVKGGVVQAGAEFISPTHPTWMYLKKELGLKYEQLAGLDALKPIVVEGKRLEQKEAKALGEEIQEIKKRLNDDADKIDPQEPWKPRAGIARAKLEAWDKKSIAQWLEEQKVKDGRCKRLLANEWTAYNAVPVAWQSYLGFLAMVQGANEQGAALKPAVKSAFWDLTDTLRYPGGNQEVAQILARKVGRGNIKLNTPVLSIKDYRTGKKALVSTGGKPIEADEVVLAIPPSTWRKIEFDPPLPITLSVQMGSGVKYLAAVKNRFWGKGLSFQGRTDSPIGMVWETTTGQKCMEACFSVLAGGAGADRCRSWKDRTSKYLRELDALVPGILRHFKGGRYFDWDRDQWAKGTYAFPAPGEVLTAGPALREGLGKLKFGGEHTCYAFVGFMEGALNSGRRLAKAIAEA